MTTPSLTRRDVLRFAASLGVSFALPALDSRAAERRGSERPKSFILLWMGGGPSQLDTFDPHPGTKIGGEVQAIDTKIPGLRIAQSLPQVAEQIDALNVIRSVVSKEGDHERGAYLLKTGYRPDPTLRHPSLGAIVTHELPEAGVEIPRYFALGGSEFPGRGGYLGDQYDPFKIFAPGQNIENTKPRTTDSRQKRRLQNLDVLHKAFVQGRTVQSARTLHQENIQRALTMMQSEQLAALQVDLEPAEVRKAYGENSFGLGCLVARRLVETGVRAIEVNLGGWDTHANNYESTRRNVEVLDPALAMLIQDLKARDLLASTVVLWIGEFGRTPTINPAAGRDHWPTGFSCLIGGGGLRSGVVLGETDPEGKKTEPADPIEVRHLAATVLHTLGVEHDKEVLTPIGRPMLYTAGRPIERLLPA